MRILSLIIYTDLALKALRSCEGVSAQGVNAQGVSTQGVSARLRDFHACCVGTGHVPRPSSGGKDVTL